MAQIQFSTLAAKAEAWKTKRIAQAGQSYHLYQLANVTSCSAELIAPPKIEPDGTVSAEHYSLDLVNRTCSCGDQFHLDRLQVEAWRAGVSVEKVECKHFMVYALLTVREAFVSGGLAAVDKIQAAPVAAQAAPVQSAGYWDEWPADARIRERQAEEAKAKTFAADWLP